MCILPVGSSVSDNLSESGSGVELSESKVNLYKTQGANSIG